MNYLMENGTIICPTSPIRVLGDVFNRDYTGHYYCTPIGQTMRIRNYFLPVTFDVTIPFLTSENIPALGFDVQTGFRPVLVHQNYIYALRYRSGAGHVVMYNLSGQEVQSTAFPALTNSLCYTLGLKGNQVYLGAINKTSIGATDTYHLTLYRVSISGITQSYTDILFEGVNIDGNAPVATVYNFGLGDIGFIYYANYDTLPASRCVSIYTLGGRWYKNPTVLAQGYLILPKIDILKRVSLPIFTQNHTTAGGTLGAFFGYPSDLVNTLGGNTPTTIGADRIIRITATGSPILGTTISLNYGLQIPTSFRDNITKQIISGLQVGTYFKWNNGYNFGVTGVHVPTSNYYLFFAAPPQGLTVPTSNYNRLL
jgi:hypothetical protein